MPTRHYNDVYANKFVINSGSTGATVVDDLTVGGLATVGETLVVTGASTLTGAVGVTGALTVTGVTTQNGNSIATGAGAGVTGGTGTVYKTSVSKVGGIYKTEIMIDITGLGSSTTDLDIIGQGVSAAHLGQIIAAESGTILWGQMVCLEAPATGQTDIDLYAATEATGVFDAGIGTLVETALITAGGAWSAFTTKAFGADLAANKYLYLTCGAAATVGTYTAGKFLITLYGY